MYTAVASSACHSSLDTSTSSGSSSSSPGGGGFSAFCTLFHTSSILWLTPHVL